MELYREGGSEFSRPWEEREVEIKTSARAGRRRRRGATSVAERRGAESWRKKQGHLQDLQKRGEAGGGDGHSGPTCALGGREAGNLLRQSRRGGGRRDGAHPKKGKEKRKRKKGFFFLN